MFGVYFTCRLVWKQTFSTMPPPPTNNTTNMFMVAIHCVLQGQNTSAALGCPTGFVLPYCLHAVSMILSYCFQPASMLMPLCCCLSRLLQYPSQVYNDFISSQIYDSLLPGLCRIWTIGLSRFIYSYSVVRSRACRAICWPTLLCIRRRGNLRPSICRLV